MLYSRGISLDSLGIPHRDGKASRTNPRDVWQIFARHWYLFRGTPTGIWLEHELYDLFGIREKLDGENALDIYDQIQEKLESPEFLPRSLFDRFNIEVLATTDAASDSLADHVAIQQSSWEGCVIPTFRPDAVFRIAAPEWRPELDALAKSANSEIADYRSFIGALEDRPSSIRTQEQTATDPAVLEPNTERRPDVVA